MELTLIDIYDLLEQEDETTILELLEISSEDLVNRFKDKIEDKFDKLQEEYA